MQFSINQFLLAPLRIIKKKHVKLFSLFIITFFAEMISAGDDVASILKQLTISETTEFDYIENRHVQFLAKPLENKGKLFLSPHRIVIKQSSPSTVFLLIDKKRFRYINPNNRTNYVKKIHDNSSTPTIIKLLSIFFESDLQHIKKNFHTQNHTISDNWNLKLIPKSKEPIKEMVVSGIKGKMTNYLEIIFHDGDVTSWRLSSPLQGEIAVKNMNLVLKSALTDKQLNTNHDR